MSRALGNAACKTGGRCLAPRMGFNARALSTLAKTSTSQLARLPAQHVDYKRPTQTTSLISSPASYTQTRLASTYSTRWTPPDIASRNVAVLGAGVLGRRIAASWVAAGYNVIVNDLSGAQRNAAALYIDHELAEYSKLTGNTRTKGSYRTVPDIDSAVKNAWLVVEALPEKLALKIDIMAELDQKAPHDCIIGSNSSSYRSGLMIEKVDPSRRHRIMNIHYQMPPSGQVVELMTCGETQPDIVEFVRGKIDDTGLIPAVARKESTGFIVNRLWAAIKRETLLILAQEVSEPKEIDMLFKKLFKDNPAGPCAMMDSVGLDTVAFIESNYVNERKIDSTAMDWLNKNFVEKGKLGAKSGKGGLYPAGETTKSSKSEGGHRDNMAAPQLYFLDVGMGAESDLADMSTAGKVMTASADGSNVRTLVSGQALPDGIVISLEAGKMFWTNMGPNPSENNGSVMSANLDGSDVKEIIPVGAVHTPKQIQLSEEEGKLYFCDREGLRIHRCGLNGEDHEIIVRTGDHNTSEWEDQTKWCVGIAVDFKAGKFYWTQKGPSKAGKGRIFRANIQIPQGETVDTRSDIELVLDKLPEPIDLEVEGEKLFWTDRGKHKCPFVYASEDVLC